MKLSLLHSGSCGAFWSELGTPKLTHPVGTEGLPASGSCCYGCSVGACKQCSREYPSSQLVVVVYVCVQLPQHTAYCFQNDVSPGTVESVRDHSASSPTFGIVQHAGLGEAVKMEPLKVYWFFLCHSEGLSYLPWGA